MRNIHKWLLAVCCSITVGGVGCNEVLDKYEEDVKTCGNGVLDKGEICDGDKFSKDKRVCPAGKILQGNDQITCTATCGLDTSKCVDIPKSCGNGVLDNGEVCDGDKFDDAKRSCPMGYEVDDVNKITCKSDCNLDTSACKQKEEPSAKCGDNKKDEGEVCDGTDLGDASCESVLSKGATGNLKCAEGCKGFDDSECVKSANCGNGNLDEGELCDPTEATWKEGKLCSDFDGDYKTGDTKATCTEKCKLVLDACTKCGNNKLDQGEACDVVDGIASFEGDKSCKDFDPRVMGGLACKESCEIDDSGCMICQESSTKCEKVNDVDTEIKCVESKWSESGTACGEGKVCDVEGEKCVEETATKCEGEVKQCVNGKEQVCQDGKWAKGVACEKGFECKEGGAGCTAIEGFCTESMCKDGKFVECKDNRYQAAVDCPEDQECKDGAKVCTAKEGTTCEADVCKEGMFTKCEGGKAKKAEACKIEGKDVSCNADGTACGECANDAKMCDGNKFKKCVKGAWVSEDCGTKSCDGEKGCIEKCTANSCKDGKFIECKEGVPQAAVDCKVDGKAVSCNAEGTACGVCLDNAKKCDDKTPKVCTKGAWTGDTACSGDKAVCVEGECKQCKGPSTVCVVEGGAAVKKECTNAHTWKNAVKCESGACNAEGTDCAPVSTKCTEGEKKCVKDALLTCKGNKFSVSTGKEATCNHYETCIEGANSCSAIAFGSDEVTLAEWDFDDKSLNPKVCISSDKTQCSIALSSSEKVRYLSGIKGKGFAAMSTKWPKAISDSGLHWKISVPTKGYDHLKVYTRVAGSGDKEKGFKLAYVDGATVKMLNESTTEYTTEYNVVFVNLNGALPESYSPDKLELKIYARTDGEGTTIRIDDVLIKGVKKGGAKCTVDECKDGKIKKCVGGSFQAEVECVGGNSCKSATECGECFNDAKLCDGYTYRNCKSGQWVSQECTGATPICSTTSGCTACASDKECETKDKNTPICDKVTGECKKAATP